MWSLVLAFAVVLVLFSDDERRFILEAYSERTGLPLHYVALAIFLSIALSPASMCIHASSSMRNFNPP